MVKTEYRKRAGLRGGGSALLYALTSVCWREREVKGDDDDAKIL